MDSMSMLVLFLHTDVEVVLPSTLWYRTRVGRPSGVLEVSSHQILGPDLVAHFYLHGHCSCRATQVLRQVKGLFLDGFCLVTIISLSILWLEFMEIWFHCQIRSWLDKFSSCLEHLSFVLSFRQNLNF